MSYIGRANFKKKTKTLWVMVIKTPLGYWRALVGINGCLNQKIPDMKQNLVFRSHRGSPAMLIPVHCVNPNHYHHFHHHHDALSVTVNPAAYAAAASTAATSCVICHLSSSLFHLHPSRYKWPQIRGAKHLAGKLNYFYMGGIGWPEFFYLCHNLQSLLIILAYCTSLLEHWTHNTINFLDWIFGCSFLEMWAWTSVKLWN